MISCLAFTRLTLYCSLSLSSFLSKQPDIDATLEFLQQQQDRLDAIEIDVLHSTAELLAYSNASNNFPDDEMDANAQKEGTTSNKTTRELLHTYQTIHTHHVNELMQLKQEWQEKKQKHQEERVKEQEKEQAELQKQQSSPTRSSYYASKAWSAAQPSTSPHKGMSKVCSAVHDIGSSPSSPIRLDSKQEEPFSKTTKSASSPTTVRVQEALDRIRQSHQQSHQNHHPIHLTSSTTSVDPPTGHVTMIPHRQTQWTATNKNKHSSEAAVVREREEQSVSPPPVLTVARNSLRDRLEAAKLRRQQEQEQLYSPQHRQHLQRGQQPLQQPSVELLDVTNGLYPPSHVLQPPPSSLTNVHPVSTLTPEEGDENDNDDDDSALYCATVLQDPNATVVAEGENANARPMLSPLQHRYYHVSVPKTTTSTNKSSSSKHVIDCTTGTAPQDENNTGLLLDMTQLTMEDEIDQPPPTAKARNVLDEKYRLESDPTSPLGFRVVPNHSTFFASSNEQKNHKLQKKQERGKNVIVLGSKQEQQQSRHQEQARQSPKSRSAPFTGHKRQQQHSVIDVTHTTTAKSSNNENATPMKLLHAEMDDSILTTNLLMLSSTKEEKATSRRQSCSPKRTKQQEQTHTTTQSKNTGRLPIHQVQRQQPIIDVTNEDEPDETDTDQSTELQEVARVAISSGTTRTTSPPRTRTTASSPLRARTSSSPRATAAKLAKARHRLAATATAAMSPPSSSTQNKPSPSPRHKASPARTRTTASPRHKPRELTIDTTRNSEVDDGSVHLISVVADDTTPRSASSFSVRHVDSAEFAAAPRIVQMQVTLDLLTDSIHALNASSNTANGMCLTQQQAQELLYPTIVPTKRQAKAVLMSLCHFQRLRMRRQSTDSNDADSSSMDIVFDVVTGRT